MQLRQEEGRQVVAKREWALLGDSVKATKNGRSLALREPQIASAKASIKSARSYISVARLSLERTVIKAPFDAVLRTEQVELGQRIGPGQGIMRLVGTKVWWAELAIPLVHLQHLKIPGAKAIIYQGADGKQGRMGRVIRRLPDVDRASQLARVIVEIDNPLDAPQETPLLLGTAVRAVLHGTPFPDTVSVPVEMLRNGNAVWQIDDESRLKKTPVRVLWRDRDHVVVKGLKAGESIISNHVPTAAPGMALRIAEQRSKAAAKTLAKPTLEQKKAPN
jgi:RND family efflux transporter MFP subunit